MGIETLLIAGAVGAMGASGISQANKQAKNIVAEGNIVAKNKADEVTRRADRTTMSFLNSGFGLRGTPESSVMSIFDVGIQDVDAIKSNYNRAAKKTVFDARTKALKDMLNMGTSALGGMGGMSSMAGNASGFQYGVGGTGRIPTGGFAGATGIPFAGA